MFYVLRSKESFASAMRGISLVEGALGESLVECKDHRLAGQSKCALKRAKNDRDDADFAPRPCAYRVREMRSGRKWCVDRAVQLTDILAFYLQ